MNCHHVLNRSKLTTLENSSIYADTISVQSIIGPCRAPAIEIGMEQQIGDPRSLDIVHAAAQVVTEHLGRLSQDKNDGHQLALAPRLRSQVTAD